MKRANKWVRTPGNTPIAELLKQYESECCDHTDLVWVKNSALRYVSSMEDSQVRCLLYTLACVPTPESIRTASISIAACISWLEAGCDPKEAAKELKAVKLMLEPK